MSIIFTTRGFSIGAVAAALVVTLTALLVTTGTLQAQTLSDDATLGTLTVSPKDIIGFTSSRTHYEVGVASTVTQATITATATHGGAGVAFSGIDEDTNTAGHQVNLSAGKNTVTITVTAADSSTQDYTVNVNQGDTDTFGWKAASDFDGLIAAQNADPYGIWSNGATMWVADYTEVKLYAYRMSDKARDADKDFDTLSAAGNDDPTGIWSNGTTMWVADAVDDKLYAYNLDTKARDASKDFDTLDAADNNRPRGIWSDETTMWVADSEDDKLYAYRMSDKAPDASKDFDTLDAADNNLPVGIWSNGTTMWVADLTDGKLYAYRMSDKQRDASKDFDTLSAAGNNVPFGIWSDGFTMWVGENEFGKVYSYNTPLSDDAILSALTVSPKDIIGFASDRASYEVGVADTVAQATVTAKARNTFATVAYSGTDVDDMTDGHQVDLSAGQNTVTITVTAQDTTTQDYTVNVNRGVTARFGWKAADDFDGLIAAQNQTPSGMWSNGTTMWVADGGGDKLYAYRMSDKERDASKDFNTLVGAGNTDPRGIWSNGATMWVADYSDEKLYAYRMSDKARDASKDFNTLKDADNREPQGIWSNGTTMWVADLDDGKIYAYRMSDKGRDESKDFNTLIAAGNTTPRGIWSNGTTMWVADTTDDKLYAYRMSDKGRDASKDFNTLDAAGNGIATAIWSNGATMWVVDQVDDKLYSYNMPSATDDTTNSAPEFVDTTVTRLVEPGSAANVALGDPITATDPDGDTLTYTLGGTDKNSFTIDAATGQIKTKAGETYGEASYVVTVTANDGTATATATATIWRAATGIAPTLISNAGQSAEDDGAIRGRAQEFRTGAHAAGYQLRSVEIVSADAQGDEFSAAVYSVKSVKEGGGPGTLVHELTSPDDFAAGTLVFTAPENATLDPNTTYTVRMIIPNDEVVTFRSTASDGEDAGGADGWSIGNRYHFLDAVNTWDVIDGRSLSIAVKGSPIGGTTLTPGVALSAGAVTMIEGGSGTYTAVLTAVPSGRVTVTPQVSGNADVTVSPASLTFTTSNWHEPQTVTVSAAEDEDEVDDAATVTHTTSGADTAGVTPASLRVEVLDYVGQSFGTIGAKFVAVEPVVAPWAQWGGPLPDVHFGETFHITIWFTFGETFYAAPAGWEKPAAWIGPHRGIRVTGATATPLRDHTGNWDPNYVRLALEPDGKGSDVTVNVVALPCQAEGALCVNNGRNGLKESISLEVSGFDAAPAAAPQDLRVTKGTPDGSGTDLEVSFDLAPDGTHYRVEWQIQRESWIGADGVTRSRGLLRPPGQVSMDILNLLDAGTYQVRARWENPAGPGPW